MVFLFQINPVSKGNLITLGNKANLWQQKQADGSLVE